MGNILQRTALGILVAAAMGCASTTQLANDELFSQYPALAKLSAELADARTQDLDKLAPGAFNAAQVRLEEALVAARDNRGADAAASSSRGFDALAAAQSNAATARNILAETLAARDKAATAGAPQLYLEKWAALESALAQTAELIESGRGEEAKDQQPSLIERYAGLELLALKEGTVHAAAAAIKHAEQNAADAWAPKTLDAARAELALAQSVLDADRTQTDKASAHAQRATELADRSFYIAELLKEHDLRNFTAEDSVLWFQDQVAAISEPLKLGVSFNADNRKTVLAVRDEVAATVATKDQLTDQLAQTQAITAEQLAERDREIVQLRQQARSELATLRARHFEELDFQANVVAESDRLTRETQEHYRKVQELFAPQEAAVYLQRNNVLLSVHGLAFPSGKADVTPDDLALLNKVVQAVTEFRGAKIQVTGHTDAIGDPAFNRALSEQRAASVAKFLSEAGGIDPKLIEIKGLGREKPVADNSTPQGRALNRRVDVAIINESP